MKTKHYLKLAKNLLQHVKRIRFIIASEEVPLGTRPGVAGVLYRIQNSTLSNTDKNEYIGIVKSGRDLSTYQVRKLYRDFLRLPASKPFNYLNFTCHAQYRMDQRGITAEEIKRSLAQFIKQVRTWMDSKDPQDRHKLQQLVSSHIDWIDKVNGLKVAYSLDDTAQGTLNVVTVMRLPSK